ncbi:MAG: hypothetical protein EBX35_08155 [Planctomycetia bacterium]|nr:hypothetical protein [Planctomycetia bacterium]
MTGTSSYTGQTLVQAGTLSFDSIANVGGGASALGAPATAGNGTIALGSATIGATLQYLGAAVASTDRVVDLAGTTGGATLDSSGAAPIAFLSNLTATGAGSKTLTLAGANTGANTLAGIIPDNSVANPTALAKTGAGRWVLSGANTYTGGTTISGGTLALSGADARPGRLVDLERDQLPIGWLDQCEPGDDDQRACRRLAEYQRPDPRRLRQRHGEPGGLGHGRPDLRCGCDRPRQQPRNPHGLEARLQRRHQSEVRVHHRQRISHLGRRHGERERRPPADQRRPVQWHGGVNQQFVRHLPQRPQPYG